MRNCNYPDATSVYMTNAGNNTVSVINTTTNNAIVTVNVGWSSDGLQSFFDDSYSDQKL